MLPMSGLFQEAYGFQEMSGGVLVGAALALATLALMRFFAPRSWDHLIAGLLAGPVPIQLLFGPEASAADRGGLLLFGALLGLLIGAMEWARKLREEGR